ncbi:MAG: hypothetical protein Q4E06_08405 [Lautropia sp.]|nr:hypothetical protein [Lautropia sp.]
MKHSRYVPASGAQSGFVMIMTLVMLAVMAVGAAVAVRLSMTSDMVGTNLRSRSLAFQSAEAALRYCEDQVIRNPLTTNMLVNYAYQYEWNDEAAWRDKAIVPPKADLNLPSTIRKDPMCLVRFMTLDEWRKFAPPKQGTVTVESRGFDPARFLFFRITARGFSPDYVDPLRSRSGGFDYQTAVGAEVRLQSMVRAIK